MAAKRTAEAKRVIKQTQELRDTSRLIALKCRQVGDIDIAEQVEEAMLKIANAAQVIVAAVGLSESE